MEIYQNESNKQSVSGAAFNSVAGATAMGAQVFSASKLPQKYFWKLPLYYMKFIMVKLQVSMLLSKQNSLEEEDDLMP